jgi:hypothetical protein
MIYPRVHPVSPSKTRKQLFRGANVISLSAIRKSLRQIANPRYNRSVENHVPAPIEAPILFLVTSKASKPVPKLHILKDLRTLKIDLRASPLFLSACALFVKQPGVYPQPSDFGTAVGHRRGAPPCSPVRFPERGPFQMVPAQPDPTNHPSVAERSAPTRPTRHPSVPLRFSLARKKQSTAQSAETQP